MDHAAALARCDHLDLGGFDDWRLPTIGELRTFVRGCPATQAGGACAIHEDVCLSGTCQGDCHGCDYLSGPADGCYWPAGLQGECFTYWSSSLQEGFDDIAYDLSYDHASLRGTGTHNLQDVRCVRAGE
jgi:hypothetical protein